MAKKSTEGAEAVDQFLKSSGHPRGAEIQTIRAVLLASHPAVTERIKWNAPSFCVEGDDRITFRLQPGDRVELILHRGAKVRDDVASFSFDDPQGLVEWRTADRGTVPLANRADTDAKLDDIRQLAARWFAATVD